MATTTTNFGWDIPQSTDLVKDGATSIAALGQDIDTSMVDLKGGTTGQVLSKASNTDMDFSWVAPTSGDITGVTAGTGITGGGTSGDVTITNSMATAIDAKGDLVVGTAADTFSRLAIGTDGQILTADSTAATGMKWATAASASAYTQLATGSLSGSTVTLSSISQSYRKLQLVINNLSLSNSDEFTIQFNGITTSTYSIVTSRGGEVGQFTSIANYAVIKVPSGNTLNSDTNYKAVIDFDDYASSTPMICSFYGFFNSNSTTTGAQVFRGVGANTNAQAITSITLKANYGGSYTFDNGTYTLYGVK